MFEMIVESFDKYSDADSSSFLDKYAFVILWNIWNNLVILQFFKLINYENIFACWIKLSLFYSIFSNIFSKIYAFCIPLSYYSFVIKASTYFSYRNIKSYLDMLSLNYSMQYLHKIILS